MDRFDSETVRNIWQRVQSGNSSPAPADHLVGRQASCSLSAWIARELSAADLYMRLSKKMPVRIGNTLRQFARQEQSHAAILKGICAVAEGNSPQVRSVPVQKAPVPVLLRQCYSQKLQTLAEYEKRSSDLQYGSIFQKLAEQEQAQCRILLQLIGNVSQSQTQKPVRGMYQKGK